MKSMLQLESIHLYPNRTTAEKQHLSQVEQMISSVAHELNNPITTILGLLDLEMAQNHGLSDNVRLKTVYREAQRLRNILQDMLLNAPSQRLEKQPFEINALIKEFGQIYEVKADRRVQLGFDLCPQELWVRGISSQIEQVLHNLVKNARDAILEHQDIGGKITIKTRCEDGVVNITIKDNGPGIPQEGMAKLFEPYYTTKKAGKGTGLGLCICQGLVQDHEGILSVSSVCGVGTEFTIALPALDTIPVAEPISYEQTVNGHFDSAYTGRVLVIEDEDGIAMLLEEFLSILGLETLVVKDGKKGLDIMLAENFDLILSDLQMPGMTGQELHGYIKRYHPEVLPKMIFMTGEIYSKETRHFLETNHLSYLPKPFGFEELAEILDIVVKQQKG